MDGRGYYGTIRQDTALMAVVRNASERGTTKQNMNLAYEIASLLLKAGANPDTKDEEGKTPLSYAERSGDDKLIALFTGKGKTNRALSSVSKEDE